MSLGFRERPPADEIAFDLADRAPTRATHGETLTGSSSFASQTTTAAVRHIVSHPMRSSKRYELTATSATSLNQAHMERIA